MEAVSIAASIAGIISLGIEVAQSLAEFYSAYKAQISGVSRTFKKLERLVGVLQALCSQLEKRKFHAQEQVILRNIEGSIQDCDEYIHELQSAYSKFKDDRADGVRAAARTVARRLAYPFRQSTLQILDEDVDEIVSHLSLALQVLQQRDIDTVQDAIEDTKAMVDLIGARQISSAIRNWLRAPDAAVNYNEACKRRHPGTGLWLIKSSSFSAWLTKPNSFLFVNGFAGSGKSILCSTAIQHVFRHGRSTPRAGIAFFFFTFNDDAKQDLSAMLRALILQLSGQLNDNHGILSQLHNNYRDAMPPNQALMCCLRRILQAFDNTFIILDALDESPRDMHRADVLQALVDMRAWSESGLHLLVTSREEPDIRDVLRDELCALPDEIISLKNEFIDNDIASFISGSLKNDYRLRKWEKYRHEIQEALTKRAKGVFRWVECQFTALGSCAKSKRQLDKLLASLPQSLDKTYERMLLSVGKESVGDARRILTLLCCAKRPLTVPELIEGIAVELGDDPRLNLDGRLDNEDEIYRICPGLIEVDHQSNGKPAIVRIAHFSVQEYLESDRIREQEVAIFSVRRREAHAEIASICLTYLLEPALLSTSKLSMEYPFALYAAKNWHKHFHDGDSSGLCVVRQAVRLFRSTGGEFENWIRIWDADQVYGSNRSGKNPSPLYYASLLGLDSVVLELLSEKLSTDILSGPISGLVNVHGGFFGNALQAASQGGHKKTIQLLLGKGADINAPGGFFGNALQAASWRGHEKTAELLLDRGADINAQGGWYGNALQAASAGGKEKMTRLLLEKGADIDAQGGRYGNALHAASQRGNEETVRLLLAKGANVNTTDLHGRTALSVAADQGKMSIVELFLAEGRVQPNLGDILHRPPVFYAAHRGRHRILQLLLAERRTDPNCRDYYGSTLLSIAVRNRHRELVTFLLSISDINVNAEDNFKRTPMSWAVKMGDPHLVKLLVGTSGVESPIIGNEDPALSEELVLSDSYAWCDVCLGLIPIDDFFYTCGVCYDGYFCMCSDCLEVGAHCLDVCHRFNQKIQATRCI